jgi:hypothetical protein
MPTDPFPRLLAVSACLRHADALIVAAVPLFAAAVFRLSEAQIGAMVAAQGAAWLLVSLPAGVLVDRIAPLSGLKRAATLSTTGFAVVLAGYAWGSAPLFGFGAFLTASAIVLGYLSESASVQRLRSGPALGKANARLQLIQSAALILAPALMGALVARQHFAAGLLLGFGLALAAAALAQSFPRLDVPPKRERRPWREIREGLAFVRDQPLLRGIILCALFWNAAFMALAAVFVPFALSRLAMDAGAIGLAQSAMGGGSLLAALVAGYAMTRLPPRLLLGFGPLSSAVAAALLRFAPHESGFVAAAAAYLLLGFGPILWFVCQNTIRQIVTPQGMLGRVGAVIQLAIYGVRSLGALAGGAVAARYGSETAIDLVILVFGLSALVIPLSALGRLGAMPQAAGSPA